MKSVLISIQPKWCELIANGKKTVEIRKTKPKLETPFKVYIYCTSKELLTKSHNNGSIYVATNKKYQQALERNGNLTLSGKVIGEFVCDKIVDIYIEMSSPDYMAEYPFPCTGLTDKEIMQYLGNGVKGYGWHICDLVIYDKPKELSEFRTLCKYRNDDGSCQYTKVECDCIRFDFNPDYSVNFAECCDYITRPPQSWCYVEELG